MWMPKGSSTVGGFQEVMGRVNTAPQTQTPQPGCLGGRAQPEVMFRIKTPTEQVVNCRFRGTLSGYLDIGDEVRVSGTMIQGVLQATQIVDATGAVIGRAKCFVATAVFGDPAAPEVVRLCRFRDEILQRFALGRLAVRWYWQLGPRLAAWIAGRPSVCRAVRLLILAPLCRILPPAPKRP
jgi:hypothetical protein